MRPGPNLWDRALATVAPQRALRNVQARAVLAAAHRTAMLNYEGASRTNRTSGWRTRDRGPNAEVREALPLLKVRSRDLIKNNAWANRAVRVISTRTVGSGIVAKAMADSERQARLARDLWHDWANSPLVDVGGQMSFYAIQAMAMREVAAGGEVLIVRRPGVDPELPVPLQLQMLEGDHIDSAKYEVKGAAGGPIIQGVEYDGDGRVAAYWLHEAHPGEYLFRTTGQSKRVPAAHVIHVHRIDRVGQVRGVPWGAPVLLRTRDFDDYEDAQLLRQKIAASFSAFLYTPNPTLSVNDGLSAAMGAAGEAPAEHEWGELDSAGELVPGAIKVLPQGYDMKLAMPPGVEGYDEYAGASLRAIAAGFGVSYEALSGDYRKVNFSSGRMGHFEFSAEIEQWQSHMLIPRLCRRVWSWWLDAATVQSGLLRQRPWATWRPPVRPMVDPAKETAADKESVRCGFTSLQDVIRRRGRDPEEVFDELAQDMQRAEELQLHLDTIGKPPPAAPQAPEPDPEDREEEDEQDEDSEE